MADDSIDMVILDIDMGYLVTLEVTPSTVCHDDFAPSQPCFSAPCPLLQTTRPEALDYTAGLWEVSVPV